MATVLFEFAFAAGAVELVFVFPMVMVCSLPGAIVASTTGLPFASGAAGVGVASAGASSAMPESTEASPLNAGIDIISAEIMNTIAAPMVNLPSTEAVPRGAKAVLETLLVNKAPASVLPGCSNTEPMSSTQEVKNKA